MPCRPSKLKANSDAANKQLHKVFCQYRQWHLFHMHADSALGTGASMITEESREILLPGNGT